jgi:hypothetical protein
MYEYLENRKKWTLYLDGLKGIYNLW